MFQKSELFKISRSTRTSKKHFRLSFFSFSYLFAAVIDLYWACFQFKKFWESIIETSNFYHGVAKGSGKKFCSNFSLEFLSIFVHISASIEPITLIWVSLEISFPPAEVEYRWCQFWSKVMTSEVEQRPRLVTASCGSQWVKTHHVSNIFSWLRVSSKPWQSVHF